MSSSRADATNFLFGPDRGWPLSEVTCWLLTEGRMLDSLNALAAELGKKLVTAGAPVGRLSIFARTLHPQIFVEEAVWIRGEATATLQPRAHSIQTGETFDGSPIEAMIKTGQPFRRDLTKLDRGTDHDLLFDLAATGFTDYYGQQLFFSKAPGGVFIVCSDQPQGFSQDDLAKLNALARALTPIVEVLALHTIGTALLDTYLGHRTGQRVMDGQIQRGDGEVIEAAIWLSDLRNFTALTEHLTSDQLLDMLNTYFEHVDRAASAHGGEILSFIGDAMLIIFPVDAPEKEWAACRAALETAVTAFESLRALNAQRKDKEKPEIRFGVGLDLGRVVYGNVGAPARMDFTVMGSVVNRTARLEALTKTIGVPLLMSRQFVEATDMPFTSYGRHTLKGIDKPLEVFGWDRLIT